jgi:hypothetical protein
MKGLATPLGCIYLARSADRLSRHSCVGWEEKRGRFAPDSAASSLRSMPWPGAYCSLVLWLKTLLGVLLAHATIP